MSIPTALDCWERNWIEEHHCIYYDCTWCNSSVQSLAEFCSFVIPFNLKAAVQEWSFRLSSDHSSKSTLNKLSRSLRMFLKPIVQPADLALWLKWDGFASRLVGNLGRSPFVSLPKWLLQNTVFLHFMWERSRCFCILHHFTCAEVAPNHGEAAGRENLERDGRDKVQHGQCSCIKCYDWYRTCSTIILPLHVWVQNVQRSDAERVVVKSLQ